MEDSPQLLLYEEDLVKLIEEYLAARNYHVSLRTLERESSIINSDYSDEVLFLRELVLDGDFDEVLQFGESFKSNGSFNIKTFSYTVLRQRFIELIYLKAHVLDKQNINTVSEVMKTLSKLEKFCESKEEYNNLCWLLTLPDLTSHEEFQEWNIDVSRLKCFNDLLECLSSFMPLVKRNTGSNRVASKDRLLQLIVKGLFYETCSEYCQNVANSTDTDDFSLNLKTNLLESSSNGINDSSNLLSWIASLPGAMFELPFNLYDIDVCYSTPSNTNSKHNTLLLNGILNHTKIKQNQNRQSLDGRESSSGVKSRSFDITSSKILSSSFPTTELKRGLDRINNRTNHKNPAIKLHSSLNIQRSTGASLPNAKKKEFILPSPNVPPVMSSSVAEISPCISKEPIHLIEDLSELRKVNQPNVQITENTQIEHVAVANHSTDKQQTSHVVDSSLRKSQESITLQSSTPSPLKKPIAFELFEQKSPDEEQDVRKRREEVLDKLKKHEQNRNDSLKSLLSDESPACTSSKPSTPAPTVKNNFEKVDGCRNHEKKINRVKEDPQHFKFDENESYGKNLKNDEEEKFDDGKVEQLSKENNDGVNQARPRGPVINGVRRPPRIASTAAKDFPVLSEKNEPEDSNHARPPKQSSTTSSIVKEIYPESYHRTSYEMKNVQETRASYDVSRPLVSDIVPQYKPISMLEDSQAIRSVCFHPNGLLHAVGANSKVIRVCKTLTSKTDLSDGVSNMQVVFSRIKYHRGSIYCMSWDPEGRLLATGSNDKTIKLIQFDPHNFTQLGDDVEFNIHSGTVREIAFIPNRNGYLISGGAGSGSVNITDVNAQKVIGTFDGHSGNILTVYAGHVGELVATGGTDNTLRLWDLRSQRCIDVIVVGDSSPASVALSNHNSYVASGQEDGSILLYDITAGRTLHTMRLHKSDCRSVRFSPDSNYLMTASYDSSISLMHLRSDLEKNPPRHYTVAQHLDKVIQCRWHPTENLLLSSSADRTSILWKGSDL